MAGIEPMRLPAMPNLWSMLNVAFFVESDAATRVCLYLQQRRGLHGHMRGRHVRGGRR